MTVLTKQRLTNMAKYDYLKKRVKKYNNNNKKKRIKKNEELKIDNRIYDV
jgi:hypothetical protein